jgi:predicted PurR-regulated permease PerM
MSAPQLSATALISRRILMGGLLGLLLVACLIVLQPFLAPIIWAAILAYVTWPVYRRTRSPLGRFNNTAAFLMTLLVSCAVVVPVIWLLILVQDELVHAYRLFTNFLSQGPHALPPGLRDIPWLGTQLQEGLDRYATDPTALAREFVGWLQGWASNLTDVLGSIGRNLGKLSLAVLTLFFFYRDGDFLVHQIRHVLRRVADERLDPYIKAAGMMTRAVLYGFLITAFAQGLIAGIGYRVVGLQAPVLLGALTGLLSVVPVLGTAFVWAPIGIGLLIIGHIWKGVFLLAWGTLLVHPTDNVLRPLLISNAARVPFLLVMLGALGGLSAYGLVGVFIGPVLLGIAVAIWREWADDLPDSTTPPPPDGTI